MWGWLRVGFNLPPASSSAHWQHLQAAACLELLAWIWLPSERCVRKPPHTAGPETRRQAPTPGRPGSETQIPGDT